MNNFFPPQIQPTNQPTNQPTSTLPDVVYVVIEITDPNLCYGLDQKQYVRYDDRKQLMIIGTYEDLTAAELECANTSRTASRHILISKLHKSMFRHFTGLSTGLETAIKNGQNIFDPVFRQNNSNLFLQNNQNGPNGPNGPNPFNQNLNMNQNMNQNMNLNPFNQNPFNQNLNQNPFNQNHNLNTFWQNNDMNIG
jgi:hypothetical protein